MTPSVFYMVLAAAAFAVFCVIAWYLVALLKQARRTAASAELFLESTRPRVEAATEKIESLITRADNLLSGAEAGEGIISSVINGISSAIGGFSAGGKVVSMVSAAVSGVFETWRTIRARREETREET